MQKIGEHLDSGDDTSICAAPLTSPLQFLPWWGCEISWTPAWLPWLSEARSAGTGPCLSGRVRRPALTVWPSVGTISVPLRFTPVPGTVPRTPPLPDLQSLCPNLETGRCHHPNSALPLNLEHQIPINSLPTFVSFSSDGGGSGGSSSLSALGSVKSVRCLRRAPLSVLL